MLIWDSKRSGERERFGVDWAKAPLAVGEQITSMSVDAPGNLVVDRHVLVDRLQSFRLSGGDVGTHVVICRIETDGPQLLEEEVEITITG